MRRWWDEGGTRRRVFQVLAVLATLAVVAACVSVMAAAPAPAPKPSARVGAPPSTAAQPPSDRATAQRHRAARRLQRSGGNRDGTLVRPISRGRGALRPRLLRRRHLADDDRPGLDTHPVEPYRGQDDLGRSHAPRSRVQPWPRGRRASTTTSSWTWPGSWLSAGRVRPPWRWGSTRTSPRAPGRSRPRPTPPPTWPTGGTSSTPCARCPGPGSPSPGTWPGTGPSHRPRSTRGTRTSTWWRQAPSTR